MLKPRATPRENFIRGVARALLHTLKNEGCLYDKELFRLFADEAEKRGVQLVSEDDGKGGFTMRFDPINPERVW